MATSSKSKRTSKPTKRTSKAKVAVAAAATPAPAPAPAPKAKRTTLDVRNPKFLQAKITVVNPGCNRRSKKATSKRVALYASAKTVAEYIKAGGIAGDIRWDVARGNISLGMGA